MRRFFMTSVVFDNFFGNFPALYGVNLLVRFIINSEACLQGYEQCVQKINKIRVFIVHRPGKIWFQPTAAKDLLEILVLYTAPDALQRWGGSSVNSHAAFVPCGGFVFLLCFTFLSMRGRRSVGSAALRVHGDRLPSCATASTNKQRRLVHLQKLGNSLQPSSEKIETCDTALRIASLTAYVWTVEATKASVMREASARQQFNKAIGNSSSSVNITAA